MNVSLVYISTPTLKDTVLNMMGDNTTAVSQILREYFNPTIPISMSLNNRFSTAKKQVTTVSANVSSFADILIC